MSSEASRVVTFEDVLGDARRRYFGHGFTKVAHDLRRVVVHHDPDEGLRLRGSGMVRYPAAWSFDGGGQPRDAHLSSIDAIVLVVRLLEQASQEHELIGLGDATLSSIALRAGTAPHRALDRVDIEAVIGTASDSGDLTLRATVGGIRISATLRPSMGKSVGTFRPYGDGVRTAVIESEVLDVFERSILTSHRFAAPLIPATGIDSAIWPGLTHVHNVVMFGQIAQVLASLVEGVERTSIDNLWMREMSFSRTGEPADHSFTARSTIEEHRIIQRGRRGLHSLVMRSRSGHHVDAVARFGFVDSQPSEPADGNALQASALTRKVSTAADDSDAFLNPPPT